MLKIKELSPSSKMTNITTNAPDGALGGWRFVPSKAVPSGGMLMPPANTHGIQNSIRNSSFSLVTSSFVSLKKETTGGVQVFVVVAAAAVDGGNGASDMANSINQK
jgi:hypothetical protein